MRKRIIKRTSPGKVRKVIRVKPKPCRVRCAMCFESLHGIKAMTNAKKRNTAKSEKRVNRRFGGLLCSKCSRKNISQNVRSNDV